MSLTSKYFSWTRLKRNGDQRKHILAIDDDLAIRAILSNVLRKDFAVTSLSNGLEALIWLAEGNRPDLIISDINMPDVNGLAFLRAMTQSGLYNTIPIVILSGYNNQDIKRQACHYKNLRAWITKPFDPLRISKQIVSILEEEAAYSTQLS